MIFTPFDLSAAITLRLSAFPSRPSLPIESESREDGGEREKEEGRRKEGGGLGENGRKGKENEENRAGV